MVKAKMFMYSHYFNNKGKGEAGAASTSATLEESARAPVYTARVERVAKASSLPMAGRPGSAESSVSVATTFNPIANPPRTPAWPGSGSKSIRRKPLSDASNLLSMYKNERLKNDFLVHKIKETKKLGAGVVAGEVGTTPADSTSDEVKGLKELNADYEKKIMDLEEVLLLAKLNSNKSSCNNPISSNISMTDDSSENISFDSSSNNNNTMNVFKECLLNQNDIITQVRASFEEIIDGLQSSLSDTVVENERKYELIINNLALELEDNSAKLLIAENSIAMLRGDLSSKDSSICALSNNIKLYESNIEKLKHEMSQVKQLSESKNIAVNIIAASNSSLRSELVDRNCSMTAGGGDLSSSHLSIVLNETAAGGNLLAIVANLQTRCNALTVENESLAADSSRQACELQRLADRNSILDVRCRSNESYIESLEQSLGDKATASDSSSGARHGLLISQNKNLMAIIGCCKEEISALTESAASSDGKTAALQLRLAEECALAQSLQARLQSCERDLVAFKSGLEADKNAHICKIAHLEQQLAGSGEQRGELESHLERAEPLRQYIDSMDSYCERGQAAALASCPLMGDDIHLVSPIKQTNHQEVLLRALATPTADRGSSRKRSGGAAQSISPDLKLSPRAGSPGSEADPAPSPLSALQRLDNQLRLRLATVEDSPFEREAMRESSYSYLSKRIEELSREVDLKSELISHLNYSQHLLQRSLDELSSSSALESSNSRRAVEGYKAELAGQAKQLTALRSSVAALEMELTTRGNGFVTDKENMRFVHEIEVGVYGKKLAEAQAELRALRDEVDAMYAAIDSPFKRRDAT